MPDLDLRLDRARLDRVRHGATLVTDRPAVVRITGPGALACLQGLLTNDLDRPGDRTLVYGALLTPKGMIVVDAWVLRQGDSFTLIMPRSGHAAAKPSYVVRPSSSVSVPNVSSVLNSKRAGSSSMSKVQPECR